MLRLAVALSRFAIVGMAISLAAVAIWQAVLDFALVGPQEVLQAHQTQVDSPTSLAAVEAGYDALGWLLRRDPLNAHAEVISGEFAENLATRERFLSAPYSRWWAAAVQHYQRATELRPQWGYAWARLARAKFMLGSPATEAWRMLQKAMRLEPYEYGTQIAIIYTGSDLWGSLGCAQKVELSRVAEQLLDASSDRLKRERRDQAVAKATRLVELAPAHCALGGR